MRFASLVLIACLVLLLGKFQPAQGFPPRSSALSEQEKMAGCPANPDPHYDRNKILQQLADVLNASVPQFKKNVRGGFKVWKERPEFFFVFDLTDPVNKATEYEGCISFLENHVYHFAPKYSYISFSHILILQRGKLIIFRGINCPQSWDKLEDVIGFLRNTMELEEADEVFTRLKRYRDYGRYWVDDDREIRCDQLRVEK